MGSTPTRGTLFNIEDVMATQDELTTLVKAMPFFQPVTSECPDCAQNLVAALEKRTYPGGTVVEREGMLCDGVYVVYQGHAKEVVRSLKSGGEVIVEVLNPSDTFGLVSVIDGLDCDTRLVTLDECHFLWLSKEAFADVLQHHSQVHRLVMNHLCFEIRQAHQWIANLL